MTSKKTSKTRKKINDLYEENEYANIKANQTRARSLTIGTAAGGVIEVGMRGDFSNLWYLLQPVEAIEVIGQLAAAAGVEIAMRPRQDFASWRSWDTSLPDNTYWVGTAPWQLSSDDKEKLNEVKMKNLKPVEETNESESK